MKWFQFLPNHKHFSKCARHVQDFLPFERMQRWVRRVFSLWCGLTISLIYECVKSREGWKCGVKNVCSNVYVKMCGWVCVCACIYIERCQPWRGHARPGAHVLWPPLPTASCHIDLVSITTVEGTIKGWCGCVVYRHSRDLDGLGQTGLS